MSAVAFPAARNLKRLKYVVRLRKARADGSELDRRYIGLENVASWTGKLIECASGTTDESDSATQGESTSSAFEAGDVLFGKLRPYLAKVWVAQFPGRSTTELLVMEPGPIDASFLRYVCLSRSFIDAVDASTFGSKMPRADWDFIGNVSIPVPDRHVQERIVRFLDDETSRIATLIAAKQRQLDLIAEKRKAMVALAVTRGLDPATAMRDSGVPWLGKVPAHWQVMRMKYLFRLIAEPAPADNGYELLSLYTDLGVKPRRELEERGNKASTTDNYWMVRRGDLIVNKLLAWMGAFGVSEYDGVTSPAYDILRAARDIEPFYYHHLFRCGICQPEIRRRSYGIMDMRLRLYFDRLGDMSVPVPPQQEQAAIVAHLVRESARLDSVYEATERTIELLEERRAALIAAAVTEQITLG